VLEFPVSRRGADLRGQPRDGTRQAIGAKISAHALRLQTRSLHGAGAAHEYT
jgi:hypothetical protein